MKVHFIAIGGSAMHNLAIALSRKKVEVSGSDDEIFEPSRSRLEKEGILPPREGWYPEKIHEGLDAVVLGMHARADNPELKRARELNLKVYSYPEYVYRATAGKQRIVIGGSHGKTSITGMLLHVLRDCGLSSDYLVGAQLEGYDCMVKLSEEAPRVVIEGDEYLSSVLDPRPKFHLYRPHIALISGIAWDHINVFPTFENYLAQFETFIELIEPNGHLVYYAGDGHLARLAAQSRPDITKHPYDTHPHRIEHNQSILQTDEGEWPIKVFGEHNLQNLSGAIQVLELMGLDKVDVYPSIARFTGASKRLELVTEAGAWSFYKDFAHAPSKLRATCSALKKQFPERELIACMELHTFSSLNKKFLPLYDGSMGSADKAMVYFNPEVLEHKRLEPLSPQEVQEAFGGSNVQVFTSTEALRSALQALSWPGKNLLMMSSGNFGGIDFDALGAEIKASLPKPA